MKSLLQTDLVCTQAYIIGELACGNLNKREALLEMLQALPRLTAATDDEVLCFIGRHKIMGRGIGHIDAHLLANMAIHSALILTRDKRLQEIAVKLGLAYPLPGVL